MSFYRLTMATYHAEVTTGSMIYAGTTGHVFITLIGTEGESERIRLNNFGRFTTETVSRHEDKDWEAVLPMSSFNLRLFLKYQPGQLIRCMNMMFSGE